MQLLMLMLTLMLPLSAVAGHLSHATQATDPDCGDGDLFVLDGGYSVEFVTSQFDYDDCRTYFYYCVSNNNVDPDISHSAFGANFCGNTCLDELTSRDVGTWRNVNGVIIRSHGAGNPSFGDDPTTGNCGVKFDEGITASTTKRYFLCVEGLQQTGTITFTIKAGQLTPEVMVPGPVHCSGTCCDLVVECPTDPAVLTCSDELPPCNTPAEAKAIFTALGGTYADECGPVTVSCISEQGSRCDGRVVRILRISDGRSSFDCPITYRFERPKIEVMCPDDRTVDACENIRALFDGWLAQFRSTGGCDRAEYIYDVLTGEFPLPPHPCGGSVTVKISAFDWVCIDDGDECMATFTVLPADPVLIPCPAPVSLDFCDPNYREKFEEWLEGFSMAQGGCQPNAFCTYQLPGQYPQPIRDWQLVPRPTICGFSILISCEAVDICGQSACSSSFAIAPPPPVRAVCPPNLELAPCDERLASKFANWLSAFGTSQSGCPLDGQYRYQLNGSAPVQIDDLRDIPAPTICGYSLLVHCRLTDGCTVDDCSSSFVVEPPPPVRAICPPNLELAPCDEQLVSKYANWLSAFGTSQSGCPLDGQYRYQLNGSAPIQIDDLADIPPPSICGYTLLVHCRITDGCTEDDCSSSFVVMPPPPLVVSCPPGVELDVCDLDYLAKFEQWIGGFAPPTGGCRPRSYYVYQVAGEAPVQVQHLADVPRPTLCGFEITIRCIAWDECSTTTCSSYFRQDADTDPPVLRGVPADLSLPCGASVPTPPRVTASDDQCGPVEVTMREKEEPHKCGGHRILRTWTARDLCGNVTTKTQAIYFDDFDPPQLSVPADLTIPCDHPIPEPTHSVTDNCSEVSVTLDQKIIGDLDCEYQIVRTWTAVDGCQNKSVKQQVLTIVDDQAPIITVVNPMIADIPHGGEMIMYGCENPRVTMRDIEVSDNCCGDVAISSGDVLVASGTCDLFGYYRKWICTFVAEDAVGNVAEHSFYVLQYDTVAPVLHNVPADMQVDCAANVPAPSADVFARDNCDLMQTPVLTEDTIYHPLDNQQFGIARTWMAEDDCGNRAEASQMVSVCGFNLAELLSSIQVNAWHDENENGEQDTGEAGMNGVRLYLLQSDTSGSKHIVDSAMTARMHEVDGRSIFANLETGSTYQVKFEAPAGWHLTLPPQNGNPFENLPDPLTGLSPVVEVDALMQQYSLHAGLAEMPAEEDVEIINPVDQEPTGKYSAITLFPNPARRHLVLNFESVSDQMVEIMISNHLGRQIRAQRAAVGPGYQQLSVDLHHLPSGVYHLRLNQQGSSSVMRFVKAD